MKSLLKLLFLPFLLLCQNASATPLNLNWKLCKGATLETREGKQYLRVVIPPGDKDAANCASAAIDLRKFRGEMLYFVIRARAKNVSVPRHECNGVKFMLHYIDGDGFEDWRNPTRLNGTFDWKELSFMVPVSGTAGKGELLLGLQESSGETEFDLSSLKISRLFPSSDPENNYRITYPEKVAGTPPLRGVMSPHVFTENDLQTLKAWDVNLVRVQLTRNWNQANTDLDLGEYDHWLDGKLDHLEDVLRMNREGGCGLRFVIDLHSPPGGRDEAHDMTMFYDKKYADHFIRCWRKIAKRFKGNPAVWGYDLINEPVQMRPAEFDYRNLQRMAAEAIRDIDPDTPIIFESNLWDAADTFRSLRPLEMSNVIYQVHMYQPLGFTHQFSGNDIAYPGKVGNAAWNKEMIRKHLQPVRDFQLRHNARIYVGEFSAIAWAPGAEKYLNDCIEIFEEYGWDWTYHAFREWDGWSVEHEAASPSDLKPAKEDTPRKKVLLKYFKRNRPSVKRAGRTENAVP